MVVASLVGTAALLCTISVLIARQLTWAWLPTIALAAAAHQLLWAAPVAVALFLITRRGLGLILAIIAGAVTVWSQAGLYSGVVIAEGHPVRVLQANLGVGAADPDALVRLVRREHIAVAMTEELTGSELQRLVTAGLPEVLPYRFAAPGPDASGVAIWSRYPLRNGTAFPHFDFGVVSAQMVVSGTSITLVAAHPVPPYPHPAGQWAAELRRLDRILRELPTHAVVVGGDFNATPDNAQFRRLLSGGFADAAQAVAAGYVSTYPTDRWFGPLLALDHVLVRGLSPTQLHAASLPGSDHRALVAEVVV